MTPAPSPARRPAKAVRVAAIASAGTLAALLSAMSGLRWPGILAAIACLVVLGWQSGRASESEREASMDTSRADPPSDDTAGLARQLRASEARWRAIVESAVDGIVVIDAAGRIEAFNHAAERLFGYRNLKRSDSM